MNKILILFAAVLFGTLPATAETDFSPFPLSFKKSMDLTPADPPPLRPGVEYALNPCFFVDPAEGFVCVPTGTGGFVIVPIGGQIRGVDDLLGKSLLRRSHTTGKVADPDDLINIPPELWPYVRPVISEDFVGQSRLLKDLSVSTRMFRQSASSDDVLLPDGTSCPRREVMCTEIPGGWDCICP